MATPASDQELYGNMALASAVTTGTGSIFGAWFDVLGCSGGRGEVDATLDSAAKRSPRLAASLMKARDDGWTFVEGAAGGGTDSNREARSITIDADDLAVPDELARTLAHELGHALDEVEYAFDPSMDHERYVRENTWIDLRSEAEATLMELQVRDDILASEGKDIGVTGKTPKDKVTLWEQHNAGALGRVELVHALAELFAHHEITSDTSLPYWDHYAKNHHDAWVKNNPDDASKRMPRP